VFERIVVAIDGSREGGKTVPMALDLAARYSSKVTVVHVREHTKYEGSDVDLGPEIGPEELVGGAVDRFREANVEADGVIRRVAPGATSLSASSTNASWGDQTVFAKNSEGIDQQAENHAIRRIAWADGCFAKTDDAGLGRSTERLALPAVSAHEPGCALGLPCPESSEIGAWPRSRRH